MPGEKKAFMGETPCAQNFPENPWPARAVLAALSWDHRLHPSPVTAHGSPRALMAITTGHHLQSREQSPPSLQGSFGDVGSEGKDSEHLGCTDPPTKMPSITLVPSQPSSGPSPCILMRTLVSESPRSWGTRGELETGKGLLEKHLG